MFKLLNSFGREAGILLSLSAFFVLCCQPVDNQDEEQSFAARITKQYTADLAQAIQHMERMNATTAVDSLRNQFKQARLAFKRLEPVMAFAHAAGYHSLNQPNLLKVEEDGNSRQLLIPSGFQVLEEELFQDEIDTTVVQTQMKNILNTMKLEQKNLHLKSIQPYHFLWMVREQLIRTVALGISGFDSPVIQYSLPEAQATFASLKTYFELNQDQFQDMDLANQWQEQLTQAENTLAKADDFNRFDRYHFIQNHIHPLLALWTKTPAAWGVSFPFSQKIKDDATSLFSSATFEMDNFAPAYGVKMTPELIKLGKTLFEDQKLSGTGKMSCATCHVADQAFTDGRVLAKGNDGKDLIRNTPTLYYAGIQAAQFYDARASNLENQILEVVHNEKEFKGDINKLVDYVAAVDTYRKGFEKHYQGKINSQTVRNALATYVRSLSPFNSKFDRNISGEANDILQDEIDGFNLFMGKAKCGTCHFAPVFNGTVPPKFSDSELEILGVPDKAIWENAPIDDDLGRYELYKADLKKHSFKTPTVRNSAKTAPYMHNGVYMTIEEVMDFYNRGGGAGIGIDLAHQTLPPDSLHLNETEIRKVIAFLTSLNDSPTDDY
ncbi:MAG: cytochrome-c peroxidase [Flammeovirgaceae bacterium]